MTTGRDASENAAALLAEAFARHERDARATAIRILRSAHLAEDALQVAFLQLLLRVQRGDGQLLTGDTAAVVRRATRWAALKIRERDQQRHAVAQLGDETGAPSSQPWELSELQALCSQVLDALPARYRAVLQLRYLDDLPDAVASSRLQITLKAYRRRLDRALAVGRRAASQLDIAMHLLVALPLRMAAHFGSRRGNRPLTGVIDGAAQLVAMAAVAGMIAGLGNGAPASGGGASTQHAPTDRSANARAVGGGAPAGRAPADPVAVMLSRLPGAVAPHQSAAPAPLGPAPLIPGSPQQATPERTMVQYIAPAPDYERTHTVVVTGTGWDCDCGVALMSRDGGASWTAAALPTRGVAPVVLSPSFPDDPSMIVAEVGVPACLWPSLGARVCMPLPITAPVAFDAEYDKGFPVVYGNNTTGYGVAAYNVKSLAIHLFAVSLEGSPLSLAAPTADAITSVYVLGFAHLDPREVGVKTQDYELYACTRTFTCQVHSTNAMWPSDPVVDTQDTSADLIAGWSGGTFRGLLSRDGGRTFATIPTPPGGRDIESLQLVGPSAAPVVLGRVVLNGRDTYWRDDMGSTSGWKEIGPAFAHLGGAVLAALSPQRILVSSGVGLFCTADGGATWNARCSPE